MTSDRYPGLADPVSEFRELWPLNAGLHEMQRHCRPFHPDYLILAAAMTALKEAMIHFTDQPYLWGGRPHTS